MSESRLLTHRGSRVVTLEELLAVPAPQPTRTWFPLSHGQVVRNVERALAEGGFRVEKARYALSRGDRRMFAVLDPSSSLASGFSNTVGHVRRPVVFVVEVATLVLSERLKSLLERDGERVT